MNTASEARKNIKYISSVLRGLVALDEELEKVGSIEKLATQKQSILDDLTRAEADAGKRIERLIAEGDALSKDAATRVAEADKEAGRILADAQAQHNAVLAEDEKARGLVVFMLEVAVQEADDMREGAKAEAARLVQAAKGEADSIVAQAASKEAASAERMVTANQRLAALKAECDAAQAKLNEINVEAERVVRRFQKAG